MAAADEAASAVVSAGLDVVVVLELTSSFLLDLAVVVVVVPEGTSGAAPDANTPGTPLGTGLGAGAAPGPTIVFGMLLMPGTTVPVVVNVFPRNTVQAPAPEALYAPGTPHIPPPPLDHPPAINGAVETKDTLNDMSAMAGTAERDSGAPYVGAGAGAPAGGPDGAPYAGAAAGGAPAGGVAAFATPVTTACWAGMEDRPGMKFGIDVVQTGQLPRPPALAGTAGHDMALQGMQLDEAAEAGAMGQVVTYAVAVTTLESQGATAVTVTCSPISNHISLPSRAV